MQTSEWNKFNNSADSTAVNESKLLYNVGMRPGFTSNERHERWKTRMIIAFSAVYLAIQTLPCLAKSIDEVIDKYGPDARDSLSTDFEKAGAKYPPDSVTLLGLKDEELLLVFARDERGRQRLIKSYPIMDASGEPGPKLKRGDRQVPEGFYKVSGLHPNSIAHLALKLDYPSEEDKRRARSDKRTDLGGEIEIHGSYWSTGCLAMGDEAIEEIFVLAYDCGCENVAVILAPCDLTRRNPDIDMKQQPEWLSALYKSLKAALAKYPIELETYPHGTFDPMRNMERIMHLSP